MTDPVGDIGNTSRSSPVVNVWSKPSITLSGLPIFSGKPGENIKEFLAKITQRAVIDNWSEEQTVTIIKYQLTGEAFELLESEDLIQDADVTFKAIEKLLLSKYTKKIIPGQGLFKLSKCTQLHKESVSEYTTRLKIIGRDLLKENMATIDLTQDADVQATKRRHEKDLVQQFQRGLNPDIAKLIVLELLRNPKATFDEVVELAQQAEVSNEILQQPKRSNEWRVCETTERRSNIPDRRGVFNNGNYHERRCLKCNQKGHLANNCRNMVSIKCFKCGRTGHKQYECRQPSNYSRSSDNNQSSNNPRSSNNREPPNQGGRNNGGFVNRNKRLNM